MRIFKDLPYNHIEDKFYNKNSPVGVFIEQLKAVINDKEKFVQILASLKFWDFQKISLWVFEEILNYIDQILSGPASEEKILIILNFLHLLLNNTNHKEIFSSFDRLEQIYQTTFSLEVKNAVVQIFLIYPENKKSLLDNYVTFLDSCYFIIPLRPILIDHLVSLKNSENQQISSQAALMGIKNKKETFYSDIEGLLLQIIKESQKSSKDSEVNTQIFSQIDTFKSSLRKVSMQVSDHEEKLLILKDVKRLLEGINKGKLNTLSNTIVNIFIFSSAIQNQLNLDQSLILLSKYTLYTLNLLIAITQKKNKTPLISEYYIEKYLKDVLEIITGKFTLQLKSIFLLSTIGFVSYFDGYENILFQNGLFHSILSDMTAPKFDSTEKDLEVLTFKESINQDFFNSVLLFLHKTSSFKEIPVHFLNKVLELPRDKVYPYRIDNVIFSLKKKRTLDENTLNDLVIPRLICELNNFWVEPARLTYLDVENGRTPTIFERSNLIQKLFKILYSIFEHNTNSSSLRYYESKMIDAVDLYIKTLTSKCKDMDTYQIGFYEPLLVSCIDFITKICYYLPNKIPSLIELSTISSIFAYLQNRIPSQSNIINLIFYIIATLAKNEEGSKFLTKDDNAKKILDKMFEMILRDECYFTNAFTPNGFITEEFYNPYTYFLRIENINDIIKHFFDKVSDSMKSIKAKVEAIMRNDHPEIKLDHVLRKDSSFNMYTLKLSHSLHLVGQFFMNITQDEKDYLMTDNLVNLQELVLDFYELIFHPLNLYSLNSTVISSTMVKGVFKNYPDKLLNRILELVEMDMKLLDIDLDDNGEGSENDNNQSNMLIDSDAFNTNDKNINTLNFEGEHKSKIVAKLVHLVEFSVRKLLTIVKEKSIINAFIPKLTVLMLYLVKKQSGINVYLSPINDCILLLNQKNYFKFLSSKLNPNLRSLLISHTKNKFNIISGNEMKEQGLDNVSCITSNSNSNEVPTYNEIPKDKPKLTIFNEEQCLDLNFSQNLEQNMRVEILDGNNPYTNDMIDPSSKMIINSHMSVLDFYITMGKSSKKVNRKVKEEDVENLKCWNNLSWTMNMILKSLDLKTHLNQIKTYKNNKDKNILNSVVTRFIYFINILNNINIVVSDKTISPYVIIQFIKFGGYERLFDICEFLLKFCDIIDTDNSEHNYPLILLLLIKNLWNIITSILLRLVKLNLENTSNINLILQKDNFYSPFELSCYLKFLALDSLYKKFLSKDSEFNLKKISQISFSFHSLIFAVLDNCLLQFKMITDRKEDKDRKLVQEVMNMGFNKLEILSAMQMGLVTADEIVNYILHPTNDYDEEEPAAEENVEMNNNENQGSAVNNPEQNAELNADNALPQNNPPQTGNNLNNNADNNTNKNPSEKPLEEVITKPDFDYETIKEVKSDFDMYFKLHFDLTNSTNNIHQNDNTNKLESKYDNLNESYTKIFSDIYKFFLEDDLYPQKISQIRKMNILFRIKDTLNQKSGFNSKILVPFLREVFIMEREHFIDLSNEGKMTEEGARKLLQNRMFINYIIVKDRSRANNIFDNMDIDEVASFFEEFNVIENSFISIKFIIHSLEKCENLNEAFVTDFRNLIYESLFIIHLGFHFLAYYIRVKQDTKEGKDNTLNENNESKKESENILTENPNQDLSKYDINKFRKDYYNMIFEMIELQLKLTYKNEKSFPIFLDEQNLIIIFSTIVENFEFDENLAEFIEKGGLRKLLKLRKNPATQYESFSDGKFKYKVVFDEAFRMFLFKIFEDQKLQENLLESVLKYIFANIYNSKSESTYLGAYKKKKKSKNTEEYTNIDEEEKEGEKKSITNNKSIVDTTDSGEKFSSSYLEVNFDDFLAVTYPLIPKNKELFVKMLKKLFVLDKRIEKQINKTPHRKKKNQTSGEVINLTLKLQSEYNSHIMQIVNEIKNVSNPSREKESNLQNEEGGKNITSQNTQIVAQNLHPSSVTDTPTKKPLTINNSNIPIKENNRKLIENQISKITDQFSGSKVNIINTVIKHIWTLTNDIEKEIAKNINLNANTNDPKSNKGLNVSNLTQKYLVDLDTSLIAFANLLNCFPSVISIVLKYHQRSSSTNQNLNTGKKSTGPNQEREGLNKTSFISFLLRKIFYVLQFYKNCASEKKDNQNPDLIFKEKEEIIKCLGFEPNSFQSSLEASRNHNIISYIMHSICYRRRNMTPADSFLINKARKKVLKEIDLIIKEVKPATTAINNTNNNLTSGTMIDSVLPLKNLLLFKISVFSLYCLTEFHEGSHVYSQLNPFEISKLIITSSNKDFHEILKNIIDSMKCLNLSSPMHFSTHKVSTLLLSELFKYIRINPKINIKNTLLSKDDYPKGNTKLLFNEGGSLLIEADLLDEDQMEERGEGDQDVEMDMNQDENAVDNLIEEEDYHDNEEEEENDSNEEDEFGDEDDISGSDRSSESGRDFFYSLSSSDDYESGEEEDEDDSEEQDFSQDYSDDAGERDVINIDSGNIFNDNDNIDGEEEDFNEEYEDEDNYSGEDEDDEYYINEINEPENNEVSVQFNDEGNEFLNVNREDESGSESDYSETNEVPYRTRAILHGNQVNSLNMPYRVNNLTSILVNNNESANLPDDATDDILFSNPTYEKTGKAENNAYFEENVSFPFMLLLVNDELFEFYKPGIYISVINRVKRRIIENMNSVFQFRYVNPFDKKMKRNLAFALNGSKEKVISNYYKDLTKMELDFLQNSSGELFRSYVSHIDSLENMKDFVCKHLGVDLAELKKELKKELKEKENEAENKDTKEAKSNKGDIENENKDNADKNVKNISASASEDLIDPEFLEHIPEELRDDVLKNQKKLMEDKTVINQFYNPEDIDPELLNGVNPDLFPGNNPPNQNVNNTEMQDNANANNANNANNNSNTTGNNLGNNLGNNQNNTNPTNFADSDVATFLYSLPIDLREEVLLNSTPEFIQNLPNDLREEALNLIEMQGGSRLVHHSLIPISAPLGEFSNQHGIDFVPSWSINANKEKKFVFHPPKYKFEEILFLQKHQKEQTTFLVSAIDEDFIDNLLANNIKYTCESNPKSKINTNQYWILINTLVQNTNLRYKILDVLIILWILDSICLKKLLKDHPDLCAQLVNKSSNMPLILKYLYELYFENKILEEFFYDDYDQFIRNFCVNFPKEMRKFFLETNYTEKGEYVGAGGKKYSIAKSVTAIKDLLKINYEKEENVLSNLIRLMLINSKSDIKKIFALKIFSNVVTNCLNTKGFIEKEKDNNQSNKLRISQKTIEMIVDLFYNFETILEISKDRKSNNPTNLLCETIADHKCFKILLSVLLNHIERLNEGVSYEMDHFFSHKKIDINEYSKPLPENILFKIIKLVNQVNVIINKRADKEEDKEKSKVKNTDNQMLIDEEKPVKKSEKIKSELNEFIKQINSMLIKCWEKLDMLLFEVSKMMKEDQKIIDPKLNRLIPYLEAFITLSHLQFLPENKTQIASNPFIMEAAYKRTPRRTPQKQILSISQSNSQLDLDFNDFFFRFCDKNKKVINLILRRYPKMFPPEILIKISHILDLENKKKYFKYELKKLKTGKDYFINLRVRRDHIFTDSYTQLKHKKADEMRGKLTITFIGEEMAIDAGGVKREWFTQLSREMFNPNFMLFKLAANGSTYMPNSESGMFESDHLEIFAFIGRVIAKAIYDGFMLDCYFTRGFYKLLCNTPLTYHDMEDYDPVYYKNLKWLLENDISDMGELYTFSYEEDRFGQLEIVDLIPDGRNISVTETNKFEYVQKLCYAKLFDTIKPQVDALQKGFYEIIPLKLITIFDHRELELVISGLPTIDVYDLKNNTVYENYTAETQIIKWFWEILESYDNDERAEFIQFVTGSSKVPLEGFAALQGIGGINKFKISKVFDRNFDRLPTAHTCTNQLDLPEYPSKEILYERLSLAIREGKVGFGFV